MSEITMIGLGAMGSALAHAIVGAGHDLMVWNRSPEKMGPLIAAGATGATSLSDGIRASALIIVCIDDYRVTRSMFESSDNAQHLAGRTLIQFSTGSPAEARDADSWFRRHGADYIDGVIMPYPEQIGSDERPLFFAGQEDSYNRCKPFLECLCGDLRYLGPNIAAAAVLDMAY